LPNVGPYIYDVSISGFTRSSIYIYDISSLRVKIFQQVEVIYFCNLKSFMGKIILFFITFKYMHFYFDLRVKQCFQYHYTHFSSLDPYVDFSPSPDF